MNINREEHPVVKLVRSYDDGLIHAVDRFGEAWCEQDGIEGDGVTDAEATADDGHWCTQCLVEAIAEDLVTP